ncbi:unnamed protein product, partial [Iphiclides podalirius]
MVDNPAAWRKASDVNWQALVDFTLKGVKHMRKDEGGAGGTIINVSSVAGLCRFSFMPIYCGSKAAVLHFSQSISSGSFYAKTGVRVLTICFGSTLTPLLDGLENRIWDESTVNELQTAVRIPQKVESASAAVLKIFKEGPNGSIWLSNDDKPAQDITPEKMKDQFVSEGKTFLVTGGASGLGARYVETFVKQGAKGVAILDVQVENGKKLAERLSKTYTSNVIFVECDVANEKEADEAFKIVLQQFKRLDVIINNAGIMVDNAASWRKASDVNWQGLVDFTMKGVKHMRKDEGGAGGTIINVSSIAGICRFPFLPIYCGSKAAVLHFSQSISGGSFYANTGVRVLTVCFGPTLTPLLDGLEKRVWDKSTANELKTVASYHQKAESAAEAVLKIFKEGPSGSIWLSSDDKPAQDITPVVSEAFADQYASEEKTFLVTGGASGLGAHYVESFVKQGAKGVAILDVQVDNGKKLAERLSKSYTSKVIFVKCDVANEKEAGEAFKIVLKEFKQLDVVINNAGIMMDNAATWRKASNVNWQGLVDFTMKGVKHMRKDEGGAGGTIINVSSIAGICRFPFMPIYCATKAAVIHFSQSISGGSFYAKTGVRVLTVCFGPTLTPLLDGLEKRVWDETMANDLETVARYHQK